MNNGQLLEIEECNAPPTIFEVSIIHTEESSIFNAIKVDQPVARTSVTLQSIFCPFCCLVQRRLFLCEKCAISRSHIRNELQLVRYDLEASNKAHQRLVEEQLSRFQEQRSAVVELQCVRKNIQFLLNCIHQKQAQLIAKRKKLDRLSDQLSKHRLGSELCTKRIKRETGQRETYMRQRQKRSELNSSNHSLVLLRQRMLKDAFSDLFPVGASSGSRYDDTSESSLTIALADAALATFENGQWTVAGNPLTDMSLLIVRSIVYDANNFELLKSWLFSTDKAIPVSDDVLTFNKVRQTLSGLGYAAQLVEVLSRILDVVPYFNVSYSNFCCLNNLTDSAFDTNVAMLKVNVALLCFSQCLRDEIVELSNPLYNLVNFASNVENIRVPYGPYQLSRRFCSQTRRCLRTVTVWNEQKILSSQADTGFFDDDTVDDWEKVNETPSEWEAPVMVGTTAPPPVGIGSFANSFFASASHSISNIFKTVSG